MSEPASRATVDVLSDKEMFSIFNSLPMSDLMQVQRVCRRWQFIQEIVCRCKSDLTLYHPSYRRNADEVHSLWYWSHSTFATEFKDYAFCIKSDFLSRKLCQQLKVRFPNVKRFNIFGLQIRLSHFVQLMKHWSKIERLTLAFSHDLAYEWKIDEWRRFWTALDSLKLLKHLALPYECGSLKSLYHDVLARLESLYIIIGFDEDCRMVTELFNNIPPTLKSLALTDLDGDDNSFGQGTSNYFNLDVKFKSLLQNKPEIFTQLTHLGWNFEACSGVDVSLLTFICNRFTSLTSLDLNIDYNLSLVKMLPLLANLKQLECLRITPESEMEVDFDDEDSTYEESIAGDYEVNISNEAYFAEYEFRYKEFRSHGFFSELTPKDYAKKLTKLTSVRCLHLCSFDFFRNEQFDYLRAVFPNTEKLHFENCEFFLKRRKPRRRRKRKSRLSRRQILLRALKRFTKLKRVYRNNCLLLDMKKVTSPEEEKVAVDSFMKELFKKKARIDFLDETDYSYDSDSSDDPYGMGYDSDFNNYGDMDFLDENDLWWW